MLRRRSTHLLARSDADRQPVSSSTLSPRKHPLLARRRSPLGKHLFRVLAGISAFRFVEGPVIRAARKALADAERAKAVTLTDEIKHGKATKAELEKQVLDALIKVEELTKERDDLKSDLEKQKQSWAEYAAYIQAEQQTVTSNAPPPLEVPATKSVEDVVVAVKQRFSKEFVFLKQVDDLAKESPFANAEAVEGLFQVLAELVGKWKKGEGIGITWKDNLSQKGFDYKPDISTMCKQKKFVGDYQGMYDGVKRTFGEHVTFGKGQDPQKCLSVHWWRDEKAQGFDHRPMRQARHELVDIRDMQCPIFRG